MVRTHKVLSGLQLLSLDNYECIFFQTGSVSLKKEGETTAKQRSPQQAQSYELHALQGISGHEKIMSRYTSLFLLKGAASPAPKVVLQIKPGSMLYH